MQDPKPAPKSALESVPPQTISFDSCPMGLLVFRLDESDHLVLDRFNPAANQILGIEHSRYLGRTILEIFPSLADTDILRQYHEVAITGTPWQMDRAEYADGRVVGAFEVTAFQTEPRHVAVLFSEITTRRQADDARQISERYLRALNESAQVLLSELDHRSFQAFLREMGSAARSNQAVLFLLADTDGGEPTVLYDGAWQDTGENPGQSRGGLVLRQAFEEWRHQLENGHPIQGRIDELPDGAPQYLVGTRAGYYLVLPVVVGEQLYGFLSVGRGEETGPWDVVDIEFLRVATTALARSLERRQAGHELAKSELRFRTIVQQMSDIIWILDWEKRIRYATSSCANVLGYEPESFVGQDALSIVHPDDLRMVEVGFRAVRRRQYANRRIVFRARHADGHWVHLEGVGMNLLETPGVMGIVLTTRDVSERRQTEERLRLTQFAVDHISDAAFWYGADGRFFYVNEAACRGLGYSREELLTKGCPDVDPTFTPQDWEDRVRMMYSEQPIQFETVHRAKDGRTFPVEVLLNRLVFEGTPYWCALARDISERKHAETELQQSEERFRSLIENLSDVIVTITKDGTVRYISPSVVRVVGRRAEDNLQTSLLTYVHPDDAKLVQETLARAFAEVGTTHALECRIRHQDGSWRTVEAIGKCVVDPSGEVRGVINYRDVTDRRQAEEERRRLEAQLRQAQKMEAVGQLAGGVAHDFNNLLTAIQGYTEMAVDDLPGGHPVLESLGEVLKASHRAARLVSQLLLFSRREDLTLEYADINDVVAGITKMLGRLIEAHIELRILPTLDTLTVHADTGQLQQILVNLCVNARDAMPSGGVLTVKTRAARLDQTFCSVNSWATPGDYVVLEVADVGVGIPPEYLDRIFEPFFTTKEIGQGTGLGLATVYAIAEQHGGFVHVQSEVGKGTAFRIYLPRATGGADSQGDTKIASAFAGSGQLILLAEDEPQVRELATAILEDAGYRVLVAKNGEEAVTLYDGHADRIAACILDVVMPKLSGRHVQEYIYRHNPVLPILHMTGYDFEILDKTLAPDKSIQLLEKPFTSMELLTKVRELFRA